MTFVWRHRSVKKTCRWHVFSVGRSGYAARRSLQSPARRRNLPRRGAAKLPTVAAQRFPAPDWGRQSCRCLESGSLLPPPAARRRFPRHGQCQISDLDLLHHEALDDAALSHKIFDFAGTPPFHLRGGSEFRLAPRFCLRQNACTALPRRKRGRPANRLLTGVSVRPRSAPSRSTR